MSITPSVPNPKKRELSSPEDLTDSKKNRVRTLTGSTDSETTTSSDPLTSAEMNPDGSLTLGGDSPVFTLSEGQLEKIAGYMYTTFQPEITKVAKDTFQGQISELVTTIVNGVIQGLNKKLEKLEQNNTDLQNENIKIKKENSELQKRVKTLELAVDAGEQYSRRNCLRISGKKEVTGENTDDIVLDIAEALGVNIDVSDIDRSHRLGKPGTTAEPRTKPRDIIVKFVSYRQRNMFYRARTSMKDRGYKGVFINEDLTKSRSKLLYEARLRVKSGQLKSAWSSDGTILIKSTNDDEVDVVERVNALSDLPKYKPSSTTADPAAGGSASGTD